jgi:alpha-1,3-rhamnosyl/mannosyltransferase
MEEVAAGAAVLVDPLDVDAIAQGISEAVARQAELVPVGLARARELTWEGAADRVVRLWRELA